MEFKDYYKILAIDEKANASVIKASYRKLARKYHPDVSKEENAEAQFKEVGEAYAVLKDPEKRAEYDLLRAQGTYRSGGSYQPPPDWQSSHAGNRTHSQRTDEDFSDFFDSIFGAHGSGFRQAEDFQRSTNRRGRDLHYKIALFLEEAFVGCQRQIALRVSEPDQNGSIKQRDKTLNVKIPAGVTEGQHIRLTGQGELGIGGGKAGDLLLEIEFAPHPYFTVDGMNILLTLPVTCWEAALGSTVEVPTLRGKVKLKIPQAANSGNKLRIKGKGLISKGGEISGDQIVTLQVSLPKEHSSEAKALYRQLAECESHFNPRQAFER
ncbi:DnaJ C-terminal domain-containing protein [Marinomonas gallaica]|uniref:DnaJ C-terminal domain-containing protein n=1 Tax=Marinomonas gallaica TaxID=1806667 RepID=UPI00083587DD|nr:DnaJ C-terminal domain-containing protein [Marinomonas gallaica]